MFKLYDGYSTTVDKINKKTDEATNKILKASGATDTFNSKLNATGSGAKLARSGLGKLVSVLASVAAVQKGMSIVDEYTNTSARLSLINDGLQTQAELQQKIFDAANRSKGIYSDMASAISKMGLMAGDVFSSNDELIAFTELMQKSFKVGGASSSEQSSAMLQLTQAMSAGKLQGDEFRSIMENAPMIADAIAKYTGKSKGELKELSSEGLITADIIKNAMFAAGDDINEKFETMPVTFADIWNRIKNGALEAFAPIIERVNSLINSEGFDAFVNGVLTGFNLISAGVGELVDFISSNWPIIQSLLMATGIYLAATLGPGFIAAGLAGLKAGLLAAQGWILANAPMLMIVATIALVIYALGRIGITFEDIFGYIGGVVGVFATNFYNKFVYLWNFVAAFINFFGNVFKDPVASVQILFYNLMVNVIGYIETMAQAIEDVINKIPGVEIDITSGLSNFKDKIAEKAQNVKNESEWEEIVKSKEFMDYSDGISKGSEIGKKAYGSFSDALSSLTESFTGKENDLSNFGTSSNPLTVEGTGSNGKVDVDMSDEDLRYLRDIAEREYINKFSTATLAPNVTVTFGDVHETADANAVAGRIAEILKEEIAVVGEGVYDV